MEIGRYLEKPIWTDLSERIVLLAGPRQVGKTTLAKRLLARADSAAYFNWDRAADRRALLKGEWPPGEAHIVLDELHKYRPWKRWIKGEFDTHGRRLKFLVTGCARLDVDRKGGDSLQGRYHHYRLHPLSCAEVEGSSGKYPFEIGEALPLASSASAETLAAFLRFGGLPEPFLAGSDRTHRRWRKERLERFFREDVRDLETIQDLSGMQLLADLIEERVASLLSVNALREDLQVSHKTVTRWLEVFDRLYHAFRIRPYAATGVRALQKMTKIYLWDSSSAKGEGARYENLVALHLLKLCHFLEDTEGHRAELQYLRDKDGREVDFLVTVDGRPWFAVEAKLNETRIDRALHYFRERLNIRHCYQVVRDAKRDFEQNGIRCVPATRFLGSLV